MSVILQLKSPILQSFQILIIEGFLIVSLFIYTFPVEAQYIKTDVLVIGGGASGTMAGIQSARMGARTVIVEETEWLGGMLTSAGVSAIDGNHNLPSGLWGEFRQKLYDYYGGPKAVETGWVSNTLFEPSVGDKVLKSLAQHENLTIYYNTSFQSAEKISDGWRVHVSTIKRTSIIETKVLIDATELGDVAASLNVPYAIGMDDRDETGEQFAPEQGNDIIQDLTYVIVLKNFGKGVNKTIQKPEGYNKDEFNCACEGKKIDDETPSENCLQMMQYGRLPNGKYMINWPKCGNDYYLNIIEKTPAQRKELLQQAKLQSLRFLYYLQTELGFRNFGIVTDEFPTKDDFPMIPYHRESRRIKGVVQLNVMHVASPFEQPEPLYRTGAAVGDYPIDHHHGKNKNAPEIDFINIKVPAYNVPLGVLVPANVDGLIVAEKSISVTNIVNGATRLQPVVMGIGQAAGALAASAIAQNKQPRDISVRSVQDALLKSNAYLMPYRDVKPDHPYFRAIQRVGATGILKGTGIPYKWANQTWFYPDYAISEYEVIQGMCSYYPKLKKIQGSGEQVSLKFLIEAMKNIDTTVTEERVKSEWTALDIKKTFTANIFLTRGEVAVILDHFINPFSLAVDWKGNLLTSTHGVVEGNSNRN